MAFPFQGMGGGVNGIAGVAIFRLTVVRSDREKRDHEQAGLEGDRK
jgi:hypothetical protein